MSVVRAEYKKLKRSPILIAFLILPIISAVMGTFNYTSNIDILDSTWYGLWTQHTIFIGYFFFPTMLGLLCSYQWRVEHLGNNWNILMTQPISNVKLFTGKVVVASVISCLTLAYIGILYYIAGKLIGFSGYPKEILVWLIFGMIGSIAVITVQLLISMVVKNFAIPVGIALGGGFLGLIMNSIGGWQLCPYSLISIGLNSGESDLIQNYEVMFQYVISAFIFITMSVLIATTILSKKDVNTK
ncbi:hypothetical protein AN639_00395 [Candidatus Epulonipiscium fishelsonii]|uniref:Uncharacterized protein n=1 Tax=Candidatus Epulonipiscium fishelsonii TaxID=77094 RepID=A0ACC8XCY8_9FIRM|nr:hypothetical protein AN396_05385 [Epulopiscium sp. SCG-B11WGA-EpuloA1]ONI41845.1 hypothetical protein AN639_00395 [Epulopiscium sp. SCG-B05WGA-EpuloA1]